MISWATSPGLMSDEELLAEYRGSEANAEDARQTELATEIEKRGLDV